MMTFTIEKLKRKPNSVLDEVREGAVEISHRDRPPMMLVLKNHYEHLQYRAEQKEAGENGSSCMSFPDWMAAKNGEK